jgi:ATP-dependent helicase/nuclease subunit B
VSEQLIEIPIDSKIKFQSTERWIDDGTLLITASPRQAADWKRRFVAASASDVIASPPVESWQQWLAKLASDCADIPVSLTNLQELQLWEHIINANVTAGGGSATARGLARHASVAYRLLREYRIDTRELAGTSEEADALGRWIVAMRRTLKQEKRILAADLTELLLPFIVSAVKNPHILLDGFDRFTPAQQSLLQALQEHGVNLTSAASGNDSAAMTLTACADAESEYRYVGRQIAATLQSDAHSRIAVVTSRQVNDTEMLRRILDEALLSSTETGSWMTSPMQAVAMAGAPLATVPLIRQLLNLLHLAGRSGAPYAELSPLLFSPGIKGYAEERLARAALDAKLREDNRHYLNFRSLTAMEEMAAMPQLTSVLRSLLDWKTDRRLASEWVKAARTLLQEIGFLQVEAVGRNSSEIRQLNAFHESLSSIVAVDAVNKGMQWSAFLSLLVSVCNDTPLSEPVCYPQVTVLPLEKVTGLRFDIVFALGFDEEALPLPAQPAPLLPFSLQRRYSLPGSSAEFAYAESVFLWQQLQQAAPVVHLSFSRSREEHELGPSPFLAGMDIESCNDPLQTLDPVETELFDDTPLVPLSAEERVRGGAAIIRNQSLCPFRAFASHRLNLTPLGDTAPGVTPADKGSLLHRALQYIWEQLRSQQMLLALDDAAASTLIDEAVEHAWHKARVTVPESTQQFERRRMASVLAAWLNLERERPPFSVKHCEKPYRLELPESGGLRFPVNLKADRIDCDGEGHKILIDYKTGQKQSIGKWIGERMAEPQLPLYAVAEELGEEDAVCFARVRSGDMGFEGLSGEAIGIKGITVYKGKDEEAEDWPTLLTSWRERIDALAAEFVDGCCEVSPQDAHACDYCGLEAVCRIDEIGIDRDNEETA